MKMWRYLTLLILSIQVSTMSIALTQLRNLTNTPTISEQYPCWSPDGTKIAFSRYYNIYANIYVMPANGGQPTQVTFGNYKDEVPAWSPDGTMIAFYSNRSGHYEIWTVTYPSGQLSQITDGTEHSDWPTWSPDGQYIAFFKTDGLNYHLWKKNLITGIETQLTSSSRKDRCPDWSHDGQWIVFNGGPTDASYWTYKIKPDGTNDTLLMTKGIYPVWSPNGTKIAYWDFVSGYPYIDSSDIFIIDLGTGGITNLTNDYHGDERPNWSPDGKKIVFSSSRNNNWDLFTIEDTDEASKSLGEIKAMYAE
jgi:Tol biopolymer transport system component